MPGRDLIKYALNGITYTIKNLLLPQKKIFLGASSFLGGFPSGIAGLFWKSHSSQKLIVPSLHL